jgi:flagellar biosynthesis anti-sigma factor FlgM
MRINPNPLPPAIAESDRTAAQNNPAATANAAPSSGLAPDQAQLSSAHLQVQALVAQVVQLPEVRQERVNALRQTVQSGSYRPRSEQVAQAVFAHLLEAAA